MENQFPKRPRLSSPLPNRRTHYKTEPSSRFQRGGDLRGVDGGRHEQHLDENQNQNHNPRSCIDKTKLCWRFMNGEECQYGDRCHFNHVRSERKSVAISIVDVAGNVQLRQTPWKTRLCNRWMSTGSCGFGPKCCFAHGESELQKRGSNNAQDYAEGEPRESVDERKVDGKRWEFKWKDVEKIGRIYGDWINETSLTSC